jgi:hypothetical protein
LQIKVEVKLFLAAEAARGKGGVRQCVVLFLYS